MQKPQQQSAPVVQEEEKFTEFTQAGTTHHSEGEKNNNLISFDTLMSQQNQPQTQQPPQNQQFNQHFSYQDIKNQSMQLHHPYNPHIAQNNLVYQSNYQQQPVMNHHYQQRNFTSMPHGYGHGMGQGQYFSQNGMQPGSFW